MIASFEFQFNSELYHFDNLDEASQEDLKRQYLLLNETKTRLKISFSKAQVLLTFSTFLTNALLDQMYTKKGKKSRYNF